MEKKLKRPKLNLFLKRVKNALKRRLNLITNNQGEQYSFCDGLVVINNDAPECKAEQKRKIALQIHISSTKNLNQIIEHINKIPFAFDCFVCTDTNKKATFISEQLQSKCNCKRLTVEVFKKRAANVIPFILQMQNKAADYDYICHINLAKGEHADDWCDYNFKHLLYSEDYLKRLFYLFENDQNLKIILPETFPPLENSANRFGAFWIKSKAVGQMLKNGKGVLENSAQYCKVFNNALKEPKLDSKKRIAFYAHYNKDNTISRSDLDSLEHYSKIFDTIVFVSNSPLSDGQTSAVAKICQTVIFRQNSGFDFAAWKQGLEQFGYEKLRQYDQLALINNSTFAPVFSMKNVFAKMQKIRCDFWGITLFPEIAEQKYLSTPKITEHLQSYFLVFEKNIINSTALKEFFDKLKTSQSLIDAIENGEVALTKFMAEKGYTYKPYLNETYYIWDYLTNHKIPYDKPTVLLMLHDPLVKKKCYNYMSDLEKTKLETFIKKIKKPS